MSTLKAEKAEVQKIGRRAAEHTHARTGHVDAQHQRSCRNHCEVRYAHETEGLPKLDAAVAAMVSHSQLCSSAQVLLLPWRVQQCWR
mmetsp:Transcript_62421/g.148994  ORF Transcript_62421/g.148994 Transcript_62421/m.148994 type:complete len:87 (-) Transcript_62421:936-1196(-)